MNVRRTHRPGLTLTESLVALFVMALGLLSLLTLFPLGALQIGQALKDDRCGQTALQADGYLRAYWQKNVVESSTESNGGVANGMSLPKLSGAISNASNETPIKITSIAHGLTNETVIISDVGGNTNANGTYAVTRIDDNTFSLNGISGNAAYTTGGTWVLPGNLNVMGMPVMIDPLGANTAGTPGTIAGVGTNGIPRKGLALLNSGSLALRNCCMLDDLTFGANDKPEAGGWLARYNWSAIVQQPDINVPSKANVSILVYDQRAPLLTIPTPEVIPTSPATITVTPGQTSIGPITVTGDADTVYVRKGGWVMDGTVTGTTATATRLANFYRISGVTPDPVNPNVYTIDLETPIEGPAASTASYNATFYFFAGLAEVFKRPALTDNR